MDELNHAAHNADDVIFDVDAILNEDTEPQKHERNHAGSTAARARHSG